jgi:hypothetical protein
VENDVDAAEKILDASRSEVTLDEPDIAFNEILATSRRQIVDDAYGVAIGHQSPHEMGADKSCAPGY